MVLFIWSIRGDGRCVKMKKPTPLVSLVVVNYNGRKYLKSCFSRLLKLTYPRDSLELIMVDNCSDDGSAASVKKEFPGVKVLRSDVNNYARANNLGLKKAKGDYIGFINNDVEVNRDWLAELMKVMTKDERAGMAGGKLLLPDGTINSAGHEQYP